VLVGKSLARGQGRNDLEARTDVALANKTFGMSSRLGCFRAFARVRWRAEPEIPHGAALIMIISPTIQSLRSGTAATRGSSIWQKGRQPNAAKPAVSSVRWRSCKLPAA
jgi:hypothetical protein